MITATHDIAITVKHIAGVKNIIADALSRLFSPQKVDENILTHLSKNFKWDKVPHIFFNLALNL